MRRIIFSIILLFPFFLLAPIVLPESVSPTTKQLVGITLISTRNQDDLSLGLQYVTEMPENVELGILKRSIDYSLNIEDGLPRNRDVK